MINDIGPRIFDNSFKIIKPKATDTVLCFDNNNILLKKTDAELLLPLFADIENFYPQYAETSEYLFSIDEQKFFIFNDTLNIPTPTNCIWENQICFRELKPQYLAFAGITAAHLWRWQYNHRFCGCCGTPMVQGTKERSLFCPNCGIVKYPGISPAIIVAITDGDRLLMAKNKTSPYKRFALIAGFVEIGETFEEAVRREVKEEVGLTIKNIRYYKSQPWSFSDAIMIGFFAELDGDDSITLQESELIDAKWFFRNEIPASPTDISIAHEMIEVVRNGLDKNKE